MSGNNKIPIEVIHKEIDLIQACITRMASNSFLLKGWLVTLVAVILTFLPEQINVILVLGILFLIILSFWYLDAFFLSVEKKYRKLYEWVLAERPKGNDEMLYDLSISRFDSLVKSTFKIMLSKTLGWFYGIPMTLTIIIFMYKMFETFECIR